jgi:hypothetical protein
MASRMRFHNFVWSFGGGRKFLDKSESMTVEGEVVQTVAKSKRPVINRRLTNGVKGGSMFHN